METSTRYPAAYLTRQLLAEPYRFDFFQAMRLLEWIEHEARGEDLKKLYFVGYDHPAETEIVRFHAATSLQFPASQIVKLSQGSREKRRAFEMVVTFMGLTGPSGVLPPYYTRELIHNLQKKENALQQFLDLFNHRIISFYYRSWEKYRAYMGYEKSRREKLKNDAFTKALQGLSGLLFHSLGIKEAVLEKNLDGILFYAGFFNQRTRNLSNLERMLSDYFQAPFKIRPFIHEKVRLPLSQQTRLPSRDFFGQYNQLDRTAILGQRFGQSQHRFRMVIGPLSPQKFEEFLPHRQTLNTLREWVRLYVGPALSFEVQLILEHTEHKQISLYSSHQSRAHYLSWNTWLGDPKKKNLDDFMRLL